MSVCSNGNDGQRYNVHADIRDKLTYFYNTKKIPNIMFSGKSGVGKSTLLNFLIELIYQNNKACMRELVMYVNCAHGKGIKFIRDELKFFAKTNIQTNSIKCIVLFNADKLTVDAQSALRRCIELFSNNTRFFMEVEDKYKLLKPILSRFCEINVPETDVNGQPIQLYRIQLSQAFDVHREQSKRHTWLKREVTKFVEKQQTKKEEEKKEEKEEEEKEEEEKEENGWNTNMDIHSFALVLYEHAYSAMDLVHLIEHSNLFAHVDDAKKYEWLLTFHKAAKEMRNEVLLMEFVLQFTCVDTEAKLDTLGDEF